MLFHCSRKPLVILGLSLALLGGVSPVLAQGSTLFDHVNTVNGSAFSAAGADAQIAPGLAVAPTQTPIPIVPVVTSTPNPDGSVTHVVDYGQALVVIADAYGINLYDLLNQNGLTANSLIFPGDKLLIKPGATPTETGVPTTTTTPTRRPTSTRRPPTLTPTPRPSATITPTPTATPRIRLPEIDFNRKTIGISVIAVCALGLAVVGLTGFRKE